MSLIDLKSSLSKGVQDEIDAIHGSRDSILQKLEGVYAPRDYHRSFTDSVYGKEYIFRISNYAAAKKLKILDIGFGCGESTLYLAEQGHEVHGLEPSSLHCSVLKTVSEKFGIPITIYQGVAEDINHLPESDFDVCIFNSSLHHCDDPVAALQRCREKLSHKGKVFAINEPLLKFYRSKKWFYRKLENDPVSLGHYGGNEHIYYFKEYLKLFLDAGFSDVVGHHHIRNLFPRETIRFDLDRKIGENYIYSDLRILVKYLVLTVLKPFFQKEKGMVSSLLKRFSLVPITFETM